MSNPSIVVSKDKAKELLQKAYDEAEKFDKSKTPICNHSSLIDSVVNGTHLTYKYVLINALLSKATDNRINPICLQAQSQLPGAFDARSVCHEVFVPFEKTTLKKVLGGSNEPFVNKPARYTELNRNNAVRRGKDRDLLFKLCDELPTITDSKDAYDDLVYMLRKLIVLRDEKAGLTTFTLPESANLPTKISSYCFEALNQNYEGEVLTLLIAGLYHLIFNTETSEVEVHPVNESGASSNEISDLDIYIDDSLVVSNELKDKAYSESDVRHAADKVIQAGGNKMLFIEGPRGKATEDFKVSLIREYEKRNFMLVITSVYEFIPITTSLLKNPSSMEFIRFILDTALQTKFKKEVISYLDDLAKKIFGLER